MVIIPPARTIVAITLRVMQPRHAERDDYGEELPGRGNMPTERHRQVNEALPVAFRHPGSGFQSGHEHDRIGIRFYR
jgi:hypothetical protein